MKNNKEYILEYIEENEFKKRERNLKKYNMLAYKKLMFEYYPNLRSGEFKGNVITENKKEATHYSLKLPADNLFEKVHGKITLEYAVNDKNRTVYLKTILPDEILKEHSSELNTYKGIVISKEHPEKDIFKINLLNMLNK